MVNRVTADGTEYTTFVEGEMPEVGQIVMMPNGKAGEVTQIWKDVGYGDTWIDVRAWDENRATSYRPVELQPWEETI